MYVQHGTGYIQLLIFFVNHFVAPPKNSPKHVSTKSIAKFSVVLPIARSSLFEKLHFSFDEASSENFNTASDGASRGNFNATSSGVCAPKVELLLIVFHQQIHIHKET